MPKLTIGHLLRHAPAKDSAGVEAAVIDVAQDFLLAHLHEIGILDYLAIKGGTGLRKFYAGNAGRFSTDLDFALINPDTEITTITQQLKNAIKSYKNEYFRYSINERRGKLEINYETDFIDSFVLTTKIDISAPVWIKPSKLPWKSIQIHKLYGFDLPQINVISLEENMSEKIARLNRKLLARDLYDLIWVAKTSPYSNFDKELARKYSVLKIWVDQFGIQSNIHEWGRAIGAREYKIDQWKNPIDSKQIDDEQIGLLTSPAPKMKELTFDFYKHYSFLSSPDYLELKIIKNKQSARANVLHEIENLQHSNLAEVQLW